MMVEMMRTRQTQCIGSIGRKRADITMVKTIRNPIARKTCHAKARESGILMNSSEVGTFVITGHRINGKSLKLASMVRISSLMRVNGALRHMTGSIFYRSKSFN
jgi:hypothetical protein